MHLISELSDHLNAFSNQRNNKQMVSKKDISMLESLLFLQAIDQCSGKRKASEALSISIDTISKYIENLEEDLGVKLISSSGKGSNLTSVAQRIVEKASKIKETFFIFRFFSTLFLYRGFVVTLSDKFLT